MIYLWWAAPSEGKTYTVTAIIIKLMLHSKKKIFSNYPIVYTKPLSIRKKIINVFLKLLKKPLIQPKTYSTLQWKDDYKYAGLTDCIIVLDEAYMYKGLSSRDKMDKDTQSFFATNGHDSNDIYLIAQHYNRLELILREMANYYVYVSKVSNPLSRTVKEGEDGREGELKPLYFNLDYYISEDDFKFRRIKDTVYKHERLWFNKSYAMAYDTKYFRKTQKPIQFTKWEDLKNISIQEIQDKDYQKGLSLILEGSNTPSE